MYHLFATKKEFASNKNVIDHYKKNVRRQTASYIS